MSAAEIGLIFPVLGILVWLAAAVSVKQMIPGSRHLMAPWVSVAISCAALIAVFALLFHDWRSERFISQGVACLSAGLLLGIPAAFLSWLVLRRGFATNSLLAGFTQGALAGLAGVSMLELHCRELRGASRDGLAHSRPAAGRRGGGADGLGYSVSHHRFVIGGNPPYHRHLRSQPKATFSKFRRLLDLTA